MTFLFWIIYLLIHWFASPAKKPSDWFYAQRAYPYDTIPQLFYHQTVKGLAKQLKSTKRNQLQEWKFAGPTNIGGRITDIQSDPVNPSLIYVASANGGVFKTMDGGTNWNPIFDQNSVGSIGALALQPGNANVLYVGTGEANGGGGSVAYDGNGLYKTMDGGNSWEYLGLEFSGSIPKIIIHPGNPKIMYVAAMGKLFGKNSQRGVYKSVNSGSSWEQIFFHSDSVGVIDMQIDPGHPDTLYIATWERSRKASGIDYGGPECNIYRTYDGGKNWTKLFQGLPLEPDKGRIGLALASTEPKRVFAYYMDESGDFLGIYRTDDNGEHWIRLNGRINAASFGWWFGKIYVDPKNSNTVYGLGFSAAKSTDGGNQFFPITENSNEDVHVDQHALFINPNQTNQLLLGNDGGLYSSKNAGEAWTKINNLPITQFYTCHIDYSQPQRLYGGTQDNSSMRTLSTKTDEWQIIWGGDGFICLVDPVDPKYVYTEAQYGFFGKSTDGGASFNVSNTGISSSDRTNWNTPVVFHPKVPSTLFLGTDRLYKSTDRAETWNPISPKLLPPTGLIRFGTITSISVSPLDPNIIYCGTDMGKVWRTLDGGMNWEEINQGIPIRWVTSVHASPTQKNKVYLTLSGYRFFESMSHVFVSIDKGSNWIDISKGLPSIPCNKIIEDPTTSGHLVLATDAGVWRSHTDGRTWEILGNGLPLMVINDIHFHLPTRKLVAATYGRGLYTYDLELPVATKQELADLPGIAVYPNPVIDFITLENRSSKRINMKTISVFNAEGKMVYQDIKPHTLQPKQSLKFNPEDLVRGTFFLRLTALEGSQTIKFIKI